MSKEASEASGDQADETAAIQAFAACASARNREALPQGEVTAALRAWRFWAGESVSPDRAMRAALVAAAAYRKAAELKRLETIGPEEIVVVNRVVAEWNLTRRT